jgi:hypothetical protein
VLTRSTNLFVPRFRHNAARLPALLLLPLLFLGAGCKHLRKDKREMVYVAARQMYLHDRVAAVSNRVGEVSNGQALEVLEHGRRFLKVKTDKNEIGWLEERAVIDAADYKVFQDLAEQHKKDFIVATGTLRDDAYLHVSPGRSTDRFYLLPENDKLQLLIRASVPRVAPGTPPASVKKTSPPPAATFAKKPAQQPTKLTGEKPVKAGDESKGAEEQPPQPEVPMEDWWLIRDGHGYVGWLGAGRVDVDVPDEVGQYAEGQRIVGAYVLMKVTDQQADLPDHQVPEYVTAMSPPRSGLPYDFDQIRVFTWSVKRHRYETAFRVRPIQGFLPIKVSTQPTPSGTEPVFSFQIASTPDVAIDPNTGIAKPAHLRTITYAMRDNMVRRTGPDMAPIPTTHLPGENAKAKAAKKKRR